MTGRLVAPIRCFVVTLAFVHADGSLMYPGQWVETYLMMAPGVWILVNFCPRDEFEGETADGQ